ncbi:MAG: glutamate synthase large subunit, partial [Alphaproteobacteria bacterium]
GKGLSGGTITLRPPANSPLLTQENTILGNVALYGATAGRLFAAGLAGDRFCVRNSGAVSVVEGCGSNGCEYMTGGTAVILGEVGENFGAGMTGGMAFVYDRRDRFAERLNPDSIVWQRVEAAHWDEYLRDLISEHVSETSSSYAARLLDNWDRELGHFWQVVPKDMLDKLEHPLRDVAVVEARER